MLERFSKYSFGKVPLFDAKDTNLFESNAIAYYGNFFLKKKKVHAALTFFFFTAAAQVKNNPILGLTPGTKAEIIQWMLFSENELLANVEGWIYPLLGYVAYVKPIVDLHIEKTKRAMDALNKTLENKDYIVGDSVTLADILLFCALAFPYKFVFDQEFRENYKHIDRYVNEMASKENIKKHLALEICQEPLKYTPAAKKEKKKKEVAGKKDTPKKVTTHKEKEEDKVNEVEEVAVKSTFKPKSKLDLLPPSAFILDAWKREYSNNDTDVAMQWFWKNFDAHGFSIWKVDYKYNDELTMTFMSNNLIGGFYNRLELAHKCAFGSMVVRGENNKNSISGIFIIRGQEVPYEVHSAEGYESFNFVKIEMGDYEARKDEIHRYMAWDFGDFAAGKVFK